MSVIVDTANSKQQDLNDLQEANKLMPKQEKAKVIAEVMQVVGRCPVYEKGDKIVIDASDWPPRIDMNETKKLCVAFLASGLNAFGLWMPTAPNKALAELDDVQYNKCANAGPPFTRLGHCVWKWYRVPTEKKTLKGE
jgi:hypothetical protein